MNDTEFGRGDATHRAEEGFRLHSRELTWKGTDMIIRKTVSMLLLAFALGAAAQADTVALAPDHPERYVVVKGDTLWDISARFLRDPWQWPKVWNINPQIENPHLIYPGDSIVLTFSEGQPVLQLERAGITPIPAEVAGNVVKLSPQVRVTKLERPVPTVPMDAIEQFLLDARVVSKDEIDKSGYIVSMEEGRLVAGTGHKLYARGIDDRSTTRYQIFRTGTAYRNPGAKQDEVLGYEALHVADARVEAYGDPATLNVLHSSREALVGDRLIAVPEREESLFNFVPSAPEHDIDGRIIALFDAISRVGRYQVVVLNRGHGDGLRPGHVLAAHRAGEVVRDTVATKTEDITLPDVRSGVVMVFRVFDKLSYALVMEAQRDIHLYDAVRNP